MKGLLVGGSLLAALAVALGAFGAHGLKDRLSSDMMAIYETAVQYHFYHALGMIMIAILAKLFPDSSLLIWAGGLLVLGIVIFSGSLYTLSLTGIRMLGAITPIGGVAFIVGWVLLAVFAFQTSS